MPVPGPCFRSGQFGMLAFFGPRNKITLLKSHLGSVLEECMFISSELLGDLSTATWR